MAVATPTAPTIIAIRLTRLRKIVASSRPRVISGWLSRKSTMRARGKTLLQLRRAPRPRAARLRWKPQQVALRRRGCRVLISPVRSSPPRLIISRGPTLKLPVMRSGSSTTTPATRKSCPPSRTASPTVHAQADQQVLGDGHGRRR